MGGSGSLTAHALTLTSFQFYSGLSNRNIKEESALNKAIKIRKEEYLERPLIASYWRTKWGTTILNPKISQ